MTSLFVQDSRRVPHAFAWRGPISSERLRVWLRESGLQGLVPADLLALWEATGGGDYFESETLLSPFGDASMGDDVLGKRDLWRRSGLPRGLLPIATGVFPAALDTATGTVVALDPETHRELARFASVDDWYRATARRDLAPRYGLA